MEYTFTSPRHTTVYALAIAIVVFFACLLVGSVHAEAAFTIHSSFNTLPSGADSTLCDPEPVYGEVAYTLESVQGKPFNFNVPVVAPGGVLNVTGTATHNGCGLGAVSVTTNGITDYRELDHHEILPFTTAIPVPATPGVYTYTIVTHTTADEHNYATASITLSYRVQYPPRLLVCPSDAQSLQVGATRQYEARYWSSKEAMPDCTEDGYMSVTDTSVWGSDNESVFTVTNGTSRGLVTGVSAGATNVRAVYGGVQASRVIEIVTSPAVGVNGQCGTVVAYTCIAGQVNTGVYTDTAENYLWRCDGQDGGADSEMCVAPKPQLPEPINTLHACIGGVLVARDGETLVRTLAQGAHEDVQVFYSDTLSCAGTDIGFSTVYDTDLPTNSVDVVTAGTSARVTGSIVASGLEEVRIEHDSQTIVFQYDVPAPPATYACVGSFANAQMCAGDSLGLSSDTASILVSACTVATQCEFTCNAGYHVSGGVCVVDTPPTSYSCVGSFAYAHMCAGDSSGLLADTASVLTNTCTPATRCEFTCNTGYHLSGGVCVVDTPPPLLPQ